MTESAPSTSTPEVTERGTRWWTMQRDRVYLPIALVVTFVTWLALFLERGASHDPNIDDYGYAGLAYRLGHDLVSSPGKGIDDVLHTGSTAPLVPVLAAGPSHIGGVQGAVAVEIVFLLILVIGAYLLARRWLNPAASGVTALAVGVNQAVLGWSVMMNFALAGTATTVWAFLSYLKSDRLRNRGWTVALGISGGLLLLSRSLAPVYAIPLALVIAADLVWHHRSRLSELPWLGIAIAAVLVLVIAGPWWAVSGHRAFHYLRGTGYESGVTLSEAAIRRRLYWILYPGGRFEAFALGLGLLAFVYFMVTRRPGGGGRLLIVAWAIMTIIILSTSYPGGTGFGIPVTAMVIILIASALPSSRVIAVGVCLVLAAGIVAEGTGGQSQWWLGPPYKTEALEITLNGANNVPDFDTFEQRVLSTIGSSTTVMTRDDDAVNAGGLQWFATKNHEALNLEVAPYSPNALSTVEKDLPGATFLITGTTPSTYHPLLSQSAVKQAATRDGFAPFRTVRINSQNVVQIWKRVT